MYSRIYGRFEIVHTVVNGVFEADDQTKGARVTLYEWTPEPAGREAALARLAELAAQVDYEVFSTDASLYLAARTPQEAVAALEHLHHHQLFTGISPYEAKVTPPPLPPPVPPPPGPEHGPKPVWPYILASVAVAILLWMAYQAGTGIGETAGIAKGQSQGESRGYARGRVEGEAAKEAEAREATRQRDAATQRANALEGQFRNVHLLYVTNNCHSVMYVAARHERQQGDNVWITQGWYVIQPGERMLVASSTNPVFYLYEWLADRSTRLHGDDRMMVTSATNQNFIYQSPNGLPEPNLTVQAFRSDVQGSAGEEPCYQ
jgi:hypothetical protein